MLDETTLQELESRFFKSGREKVTDVNFVEVRNLR